MERRGGAPVPLRLAGERRVRGKQVQELDEALHRLRAARRQFPGRYFGKGEGETAGSGMLGPPSRRMQNLGVKILPRVCSPGPINRRRKQGSWPGPSPKRVCSSSAWKATARSPGGRRPAPGGRRPQYNRQAGPATRADADMSSQKNFISTIGRRGIGRGRGASSLWVRGMGAGQKSPKNLNGQTSILKASEDRPGILESDEVNKLVRHYSHLDESLQATEEWWAGAVALVFF